MSKHTGCSMNGTMEYIIDKKRRKAINKKQSNKKKKAKVCLKCECNNEGWCTKYRQWCNKVNDRCQ